MRILLKTHFPMANPTSHLSITPFLSLSFRWVIQRRSLHTISIVIPLFESIYTLTNGLVFGAAGFHACWWSRGGHRVGWGGRLLACLGEEYEVGVGNASKHIKPTGLQQCLGWDQELTRANSYPKRVRASVRNINPFPQTFVPNAAQSWLSVWGLSFG